MSDYPLGQPKRVEESIPPDSSSDDSDDTNSLETEDTTCGTSSSGHKTDNSAKTTNDNSEELLGPKSENGDSTPPSEPLSPDKESNQKTVRDSQSAAGGNVKKEGVDDQPDEGNVKKEGVDDQPDEGNIKKEGVDDQPDEGNIKKEGVDGAPAERKGKKGGLVDVPAAEIVGTFKSAQEALSKLVANLNQCNMVQSVIKSADDPKIPFPLQEKAIALRGAASWLNLIQSSGVLKPLQNMPKESGMTSTEPGDGMIRCSSPTLKLLDILSNIEEAIPIFDAVERASNTSEDDGSDEIPPADFDFSVMEDEPKTEDIEASQGDGSVEGSMKRLEGKIDLLLKRLEEFVELAMKK